MPCKIRTLAQHDNDGTIRIFEADVSGRLLGFLEPYSNEAGETRYAATAEDDYTDGLESVVAGACWCGVTAYPGLKVVEHDGKPIAR